MKPLIAITPQTGKDSNDYVCKEHYVAGILRAGGIPVILPFTEDAEDIEQIVHRFDGLLLAGGPDFDPALYGEEKMPQCGRIFPIRDGFELKMIPAWLKSGKPVLAICRGMQALNIAQGGTLYQDIPTQIPSEICHQMTEVSNKTIHSVDISPDTPLFSVFGKEKVMVNSYHHQSVKTLGDGFVVMARAQDGVIEAMYRPDHKFCLALQWHPERLEDADTALLFKTFIAAAK